MTAEDRLVWQRKFVRCCLGLVAVVMAALLYFGIGLWQERANARSQLIQEQDRVSDAANNKIAGIMAEVEAVARLAARDVAALQSHKADTEHVIGRLIARYPEITAIGVAFEPFAFDPDYRLAGPLVLREAGGFRQGRIEVDYDYTAPTVSWYHEALRQGQVWDSPRTDPANGETYVDFALSVQLMGGQRAVVRVTYPLSRIASVVTHLDLGHHGYGALLAKDGRILVSPGLDDQTGGEAKSYARGDNANFLSQITGYKSRLATRSIRGPGWTLVTVHSWQDLQLDFSARYRRILLLTMLAVVLPILLGGAHIAHRAHLVSTEQEGNAVVRQAWRWSSLVALGFVLAIAAIWALTLETKGSVRTHGQMIAGLGALDSFERRVLRQALKEERQLPVFIPTGVFLQSIEFLSANNLVLTGYVWQRYPKGSTLVRGVTLPEAEEVDMTEVFRQYRGQDEVIGWRIRATVRQAFSYERFPFDREAIWLRFWPADIVHSVVLVPDFSAYRMTNPSALPGLERTLFISGWSAIKSFFEYRQNGYNSDFGIDAAMSHGGQQELYFNVEIVRNFLDPFVSHITPILLVLLLIFAMQMTVTRHAGQKELLGFNAATIITTCAALFFAVLISHIEVRGAISATKIFYGEYFYLITYAVILAACINAILFTYDTSLRWVQYRDNLLAKILYWPTVMAAMYLVTFVIFY
ncbi:cache domain-containing protein [Govanella unica]|uniref:Cache domain-containing protein n=1 Tax=Govanella unica TaxID=2975056 RepID=A0A9X3TVA2_9PROT|nr:cache domain-containing protein [Govania unica]MDA5192493.1 cache domain-containing protein [Govania unica]